MLEDRQKLFLTALFAGVTATVINSWLYYFYKAIGWISPHDLVSGQPFNIILVICASFFPPIAGGVLFMSIAKFSVNPVRVFTIMSYIFLLPSLLNPFIGIKEVTLEMALALDTM